jgi:hypothetical protein
MQVGWRWKGGRLSSSIQRAKMLGTAPQRPALASQVRGYSDGASRGPGPHPAFVARGWGFACLLAQPLVGTAFQISSGYVLCGSVAAQAAIGRGRRPALAEVWMAAR